jgi:hypothetical protein
MKTKKQAIRIAVMGMETRTRNLLKMVFDGPCKGDYLLIEDIESAQACIFDLDTIDGRNLWETHNEHYLHLPTIILSLNEKASAGAFYVGKPISFDHFVNTLEKIKALVPQAELVLAAKEVAVKTEPKNNDRTKFATLHDAKLATEVAVEKEEEALHQWCGQLEDIDPKNPEAIQNVYYDPNQYMQSFLGKAWDISKKSETKAILLDGLYTPMVIFHKKNQLLCPCTLKDNNLRTMALLPIAKNRLHMTVLTEKELNNYIEINHLIKNPLDSFLWQVSLWTARGRLPKGSDLNKDVILLHWPNFTRLVVTPYALKISALWMSKPHSLLETAKILEIPQRYVFAFYSATSAIKLALLDRRVSQQPLPKDMLDRRVDQRSLNSAAANPIPKRGFLQRLLGRLHS